VSRLVKFEHNAVRCFTMPVMPTYVLYQPRWDFNAKAFKSRIQISNLIKAGCRSCFARYVFVHFRDRYNNHFPRCVRDYFYDRRLATNSSKQYRVSVRERVRPIRMMLSMMERSPPRIVMIHYGFGSIINVIILMDLRPESDVLNFKLKLQCCFGKVVFDSEESEEWRSLFPISRCKATLFQIEFANFYGSYSVFFQLYRIFSSRKAKDCSPFAKIWLSIIFSCRF